MGTFYRAPKPGEPPFVEVGTKVGADTTVGIVEVMKLMSSIQAGAEGEVTRVLVEDGQLVEAGQPLFVLRVVP
ncbi:acetyl-CoA carboxylase biotin carboxyl carrier protein [Nocardioides soli]|uniref:Biotin carboxyl carrier protein n=1 Tax=Nocardioides soli TaxID=1036020 RepID=A0A7W4Z408_9ACTN|nr:biotin/lipoyl-containing protein [Nocardioides soli]MBB3045633.1 biotin carboxyl carrier protein [Nocardioides soli]